MARSVLTRNLLLLGLASLFTDISSHMVFPLLPLFVTAVLGAGGLAVGLIEGAAEAVSAALKAWSGNWSDRLRRRQPFVLGGYAVSTVVKLLFVVAASWPLVLLARAGERIGKGLRSAPRDALIADEVTPETRGRAYGFQRAMDGLGAFLGALAAWWLMQELPYRDIFLWAALPAVIGVAMVMGVREPPRDAALNATAPARLRFADLPPPLRRAIAGCALFGFGQFGVAFFLLAATARGFDAREAIAFYLVFNGANTIASLPAGRLSDRFGRAPVLIGGYALFALSAALLLADGGAFALPAAFACYGVAMAAVDGTQRALVADLAPKALRATAMGAYHGAIALVALPGGLAAGWLWQQMGPAATAGFGMVLALAAIAVVRTR